MQLRAVLDRVSVHGIARSWGGDIEVSSVTCHPHKVKKGTLFFSLHGSDQRGKSEIEEATHRGAVRIVTDAVSFQGDIFVSADSVREAYAWACANFHGNPSRQLTVVGVTGTNGKSTIAYMLYQVLRSFGKSAGLIGTVLTIVGEDTTASRMTTPDPEELFALLASMRDRGVTHVVMETSSHALDQHRVTPILFDQALFSNLTPDHLDYHGTLDQYARAKERLFTLLQKSEKTGVGLFNLDDFWGERFYKRFSAQKISFGFHSAATICARSLRVDRNGLTLSVTYKGQEYPIASRLRGRYNASNIVACFSAAVSMGLPPSKVAEAFREVDGVEGRMEYFGVEGQFDIVIDYAHTEDALSQVLSSVRDVTSGRVIVVFGCGGDRDTSKRSCMGRVANQKADWSVITSDNPRSEDPRAIIGDIETGFTSQSYEVVVDRQAAIQRAIQLAAPGDTVLIAGKGHENTQVIGTRTVPFKDKDVVMKVVHGS